MKAFHCHGAFIIYYNYYIFQFGKLVYEVTQAKQGEATDKFQSLIEVYSIYWATQDMLRYAIENHSKRRPNEIQLVKGDIIKLQANKWNGYSSGWLQQNQLYREFPSYKVELLYDTFNYSSKTHILVL